MADDADPQVQTDATQDSQIQMNQETMNKFLKWMADTGQSPDFRPDDWKQSEPGPIPYTDNALFPVFLINGHLVKRSGGRYVDACHEVPPAPFNPYWGLKDHTNERIGILAFDKKAHKPYILDHGQVTRSQRLERIAEVIAQTISHTALKEGGQ